MSDSGFRTWVGGRLVAPDEPAIRAADRALVGHGVFEAIKVIDGVPFAKRRHLERLVASGEGARVTVDLDEVEAGIAGVLGDPPGREVRCWLRVTVTGGPAVMGGAASERPTVVAATGPIPDWDVAGDVVVVPWRRNERGALSGLKTTSYLENGIALTHARGLGADEGIFANTVGNLCEGTGTNIYVIVDGEIVTPPLSAGPLNGVTRQLLLEWVPGIVQRDLPIEVLDHCDEAFLTSTSRDVHPIRTVDGRQLSVIRGDLTAEAADCFAARAAADLDP